MLHEKLREYAIIQDCIMINDNCYANPFTPHVARLLADEIERCYMPKGYYKKKPIVIEAWQFNGNFQDAPQWMIDAFDRHEVDIVETDNPFLLIDTLEGVMKAKVGDYIIKGIVDELYPCKGDIFEETYEEVSTPIEMSVDPSVEVERYILGWEGAAKAYNVWYVPDKNGDKIHIGDVVRDKDGISWIVNGFVFEEAPKLMFKHGSWAWASECERVD